MHYVIPKSLAKKNCFCVLKSKVADQDLKRNAQQIWQSLYVLALLTKHNETVLFLCFASWNDVISASTILCNKTDFNTESMKFDPLDHA
ncbi:MAG: hypothetical protein A3D31_02355 [Candidatus Fluviicola riflensis]|nr:MAG: hypothetical protein CHH17_12685 [Candidatus Fluviicola riflensis]OGS78834.1 MAG: hypothetical protein A3D31_02355 [Candidatus Fluviicola riflensis]OGS85856.1 MAG: hypothetical protein A3E30_09840 [Fluviicola sp. RIFCSPHIGHO2_12_FULL_43_24]OGS86265.1 MAG: hypothetical protein A2724_01810 [Fluviicola sp. RIFCSPHIGHO2_01_FULL_43_53]